MKRLGLEVTILPNIRKVLDYIHDSMLNYTTSLELDRNILTAYDVERIAIRIYALEVIRKHLFMSIPTFDNGTDVIRCIENYITDVYGEYESQVEQFGRYSHQVEDHPDFDVEVVSELLDLIDNIIVDDLVDYGDDYFTVDRAITHSVGQIMGVEHGLYSTCNN